MSLNPSAVDLAVARILEDDSKRNVRRGSATRIFVIDPWSAMNQPLVDEAIALRDQLSVAKMITMSEADADDLAANFAVARRSGAPARGVVRVYFSEAATVSVTTLTRFSTGDGVEFAPVAQIDVSSAEMRLNVEGDLFFVDVPVEASVVGENGNIAAATVNAVLDGPSGVAYVTNKTQFDGGEPRETNAQLAARIPQAIALRAMVSKPGIGTIIQDRFPEISALVTIGKLDPEMERDVVSGTDLSVGGKPVGDADPFHVGGFVDVYIRTLGYVTQSATLVYASGDVRPILVFGRAAEDDAEVSVPFTAPFLGVLSIQLGDPTTGICTGAFLEEGLDFETVPEDSGTAFSTRGVWRVHLLASGPNFGAIVNDPGSSLMITYFTNIDVAQVQVFIENDAIRNLCADTLIKAMVPVFVDVDVTYLPRPSEQLASGEIFAAPAVVEEAINSFLLAAEHADGFNLDDLYRALYALPIDRVNKPIIVRTTMMDNHGITESLPPADEFIVMLKTRVAALQNTTRIALPGLQIKDRGVGLGDELHMTWNVGDVVHEDGREIIGVERLTPADTDLSVLVLATALPALAVPVDLEVRRRTVGNVASVPRISRLLPRTIRALALPV